jgi:cytochrome c oxidase subunit 1
MMGAGTLGVPRRHWDITFSDAPIAYAHSAGAFLMMGLNGIFAIIAALGGMLFVLIAVATVVFGRKLKAGENLVFPLHKGGGAAVSHYGSYFAVKLPGTIVLVAIFFVSFVLYYFINWKYLSELWLFR